jgi:hypothetical protein
MMVRLRLEVRLAVGLLVLAWLTVAVLVALGYRPGGPWDGLVALAALTPALLALVALLFPPGPVSRADARALVSLALVGVLVLVPTAAGLAHQLELGGPQTLLPSVEAAYPWLVALALTGILVGRSLLVLRRPSLPHPSLTVAGRWRREPAASGSPPSIALARWLAARQRLLRAPLARWLAAAAAGFPPAVLVAVLVAGSAVANDLALADRQVAGSPFGPSGDGPPPPCDAPLDIPSSARFHLELRGEVDGHSLGGAVVDGIHRGDAASWTGEVATVVLVGRVGEAWAAGDHWRWVARQGWLPDPGPAPAVPPDVLAVRFLLASGLRETAEDHGLATIDGARSRHCRLAVDGGTVAAALPQIHWLVGGADIHRWRGEVDYWVFLDGAVGYLTVALGGEAFVLQPPGIQGALHAALAITDRGAPLVVPRPG